MKRHPSPPPPLFHPSEAAIREKAHELYMRSGWIHGRDRDNLLAAEALLTAHPPGDTVPSRSQHRGVVQSHHRATA